MNNIVLKFGPFAVHWYGIFVAGAFIISYWLTQQNAKRYGINTDKLDMLFFKLTFAIIIGARLAYVISNLSFFKQNPWEIIRIDHGGLGSHGAIIVAMILGFFWCQKAGITYWTMADAVAPGITVGHIFVRLGNFINGELYGPPTKLPWGVKFPTTLVPVHPSQLYEVLISIVILPFAIKWSNHPKYPGYAFLRLLLVHSIVRFFMDFFRQNTPLTDHLVLTQIIALIFSISIFGYLWYLESTNKT